jgi:hypothetical protein
LEVGFNVEVDIEGYAVVLDVGLKDDTVVGKRVGTKVEGDGVGLKVPPLEVGNLVGLIG